MMARRKPHEPQRIVQRERTGNWLGLPLELLQGALAGSRSPWSEADALVFFALTVRAGSIPSARKLAREAGWGQVRAADFIRRNGPRVLAVQAGLRPKLTKLNGTQAPGAVRLSQNCAGTSALSVSTFDGTQAPVNTTSEEKGARCSSAHMKSLSLKDSSLDINKKAASAALQDRVSWRSL